MNSKKKMGRKQEYEFYGDPENLAPQGEAVRRRTTLSRTVPVRVSPQMLDEARSIAEADHRSLGSFIRLAIAHELERRRPTRSRPASSG